MNPTYNNSFDSFGYGGQVGNNNVGGQPIMLSSSKPEKKTKKIVIIISLLVSIMLAVGLMMVVLFRKQEASTEKNEPSEALAALNVVANYAYFCGVETEYISLMTMDPDYSCLLGLIESPIDVDKNDAKGFFDSTLKLVELYKKYSSAFYSDEDGSSGKALQEDDEFLVDALNFLALYVENYSVFNSGNFGETEDEYLKKFDVLNSLDSNIAKDYIELQKDAYEADLAVLTLYNAKGCYNGAELTSECIEQIDFTNEEKNIVYEGKKAISDVDEYPGIIVKKFFNYCIGNALTLGQDKEDDE